LARESTACGASRENAKDNFFVRIEHYLNEGDTALHMAAAANHSRVAEELIAKRADVRARNRRGAEPLHYAVDVGPNSPVWSPADQTAIIAMLVRAGADPNARDKSGVSPLHRAVRNRCAAAVSALIKGGADPCVPNKSGSTPMLLATLNTGKSGSGSPAAKEQQQEILRILTAHGAK
jgi:ankyrin repeat protein